MPTAAPCSLGSLPYFVRKPPCPPPCLDSVRRGWAGGLSQVCPGTITTLCFHRHHGGLKPVRGPQGCAEVHPHGDHPGHRDHVFHLYPRGSLWGPGVGARRGDPVWGPSRVWGPSVGTQCEDPVWGPSRAWGPGMGAQCGDPVWGLS